MIFLRDFYDENHKVSNKNQWVWYVHIVSYMYIIYVYFFSNAVEFDKSTASKMWIPLDILLTICIFMYQAMYKLMADDDEYEDDIEEDDQENNQILEIKTPKGTSTLSLRKSIVVTDVNTDSPTVKRTI